MRPRRGHGHGHAHFAGPNLGGSTPRLRPLLGIYGVVHTENLTLGTLSSLTVNGYNRPERTETIL